MGVGQRKPVQLVFIPTQKTAAGNWQQQPKDFYNTWAEISNPSGFRDYAQGQIQMGETKRFLMRFRFDLFPGADWKIKYAGKEYVVTEVTKVKEKQFYWTIRATAK